MTSELVGGARRADARANHAALLQAAAALVGQGGIAVPYEEIALAAGVGRATVYRHFPTREALSRAIIDAALDHWEAVLADLPPGAGQFEELFGAWVRMQQDRSQGVDLLARSASEEVLREGRRRFEATLRQPTQQAQEAGIVHPHLTAADVRIILTMLSAALRSSEPARDRRRAVELARSMLFLPRAVRPGRERWSEAGSQGLVTTSP
jgi:AcrR family transcriptional regulator